MTLHDNPTNIEEHVHGELPNKCQICELREALIKRDETIELFKQGMKQLAAQLSAKENQIGEMEELINSVRTENKKLSSEAALMREALELYSKGLDDKGVRATVLLTHLTPQKHDGGEK